MLFSFIHRPVFFLPSNRETGKVSILARGRKLEKPLKIIAVYRGSENGILSFQHLRRRLRNGSLRVAKTSDDLVYDFFVFIRIARQVQRRFNVILL